MKKRITLSLSCLALLASSIFATTNEASMVLTPLLGNCENGYGQAIWTKGDPNGVLQGSIYEGYFKNRLPDGFGKLLLPEHDFVMLAEFKEGKQEGLGVILNGNGKLIYAGELLDFESTGRGICISDSGEATFLTDDDTADYDFLTVLPSGELKYQEVYKITPTTDTNSSSGILIPKDLKGCFAELNVMLTPEFVEKIKQGSEEDMSRFHHGLGTWMRNNWGLWNGSQLSQWFNEKGIHHPDVMSGIILDSYWRYLNDKTININEPTSQPKGQRVRPPKSSF